MLDPTTVRLSNSFLLSDFMGCDSVYRRGLKNQIGDGDKEKIDEGRYLAENLEKVQEFAGPLSVVYGFISPELSRRLVTYMDPNKPSYHRWDDGAAADIIPHEWYIDGCAPVFFAYNTIKEIPVSRIITYAESEAVCVATKRRENRHKSRKAFYENRYIGEKEPKFIKYSAVPKTLDKQISSLTLEHDWRGKGYPSYHGGGRRQYEHIRLEDYVVMSDLLYVPQKVHAGKPNQPWDIGSEQAGRFQETLAEASQVLNGIISRFDSRMSIVYGFDRCNDVDRNWSRCFELSIVPPRHLDYHDICHYVETTWEARCNIVFMKSGDDRIMISGKGR